METSSFQLWKRVNEITVFQAVLLAVGSNPDGKQFDKNVKSPEGFDQFTAIIIEGIQQGKIKAKGAISKVNMETLISAKDVQNYFKEKEIVDKFFCLQPSCYGKVISLTGGLLNQSLAPTKIEAANELIRKLNMKSPKELKGRLPKEIIETELLIHPTGFGLKDKNGDIPAQTVEEICKVLNWKPYGGKA